MAVNVLGPRVQVVFCDPVFNVYFLKKKFKIQKMSRADDNVCWAINIEGIAAKATFQSRVVVGGKIIRDIFFYILIMKKYLTARLLNLLFGTFKWIPWIWIGH